MIITALIVDQRHCEATRSYLVWTLRSFRSSIDAAMWCEEPFCNWFYASVLLIFQFCKIVALPTRPSCASFHACMHACSCELKKLELWLSMQLLLSYEKNFKKIFVVRMKAPYIPMNTICDSSSAQRCDSLFMHINGYSYT